MSCSVERLWSKYFPLDYRKWLQGDAGAREKRRAVEAIRETVIKCEVAKGDTVDSVTSKIALPVGADKATVKSEVSKHLGTVREGSVVSAVQDQLKIKISTSQP